MSKKNTGTLAEEKALAYLAARGLSLIEKNFSCSYGEIDIIMRDGEDLVFVEVRRRSSSAYGGALASVDTHKQRKLQRTACHYMMRKYGDMLPPCRFDLILLDGKEDSLQWQRDVRLMDS